MGQLITSVGIVLLLGSIWALLAVLVLATAIVARTAMEDRTLQNELEGYKAYAQSVRYRLFPGIW
jgi:protein-S-isoprenylcysteine O-methyltransferase Ste14